MNDNLMWYVCYGSNLYFDRFKCYLTGEACAEYNIEKIDERKCSDPTLPEEENRVRCDIPYELYFDHESSTWKGSSVAFLDPDKKGKTIGKAYLVTKEQFEHIMLWECSNGKVIPGPHSLYGHVIDLGIFKDHPAKTFTRFERLNNVHEVLPPYRDCMKKGLMECGLSEGEAIKYIEDHIK